MVKYAVIPAEDVIFRENFINNTFVSDNGITLTAAPIINKGLTVNGTTQYAETRFNLDNLSSFSIEAWVSVTAVDVTWQPILCNGFNAATGVMLSINNARFILSIPNGAYEGIPTSDIELEANTLYHVVGTYDGTNALVYVNGQLDTATGAFTKNTSGGKVTTIGAAVVGGDYGAWSDVELGGTIYNVNVYDKVLTQAEVTDKFTQETFSEVDASKAELFLPLRTHFDDSGNEITPNLGLIATGNISWGDGSTASTYPTLIENNGAAFSTDYIRINETSTLGINAVSDKITVAAMVKIDALGTNQTVIENSLNWLVTIQAEGTVGLQFNDAGNAYHKYNFSDGALAVGQWYHICCTYDGSDTIAGDKVYINGVLQGTSVSAWHPGIANGGSVGAIGVRTTNFTSTPLTGSLKLPMVFMSELSATQAKWLSDRAFRELNL